MEFDLKEIATTIIIGAYLIFGLELLLYIFLHRSIYLHLLSLLEGRNLSPNLLIVVALASTFAFGILIEALSEKFVDEDTFLQKYIIGLIPQSMTDDEIKEEVLLGKKVVSPLGLEAARRDLLRQYGGEFGGEVQRVLLCNKNLQGITAEQKSAVAKQFYYHAKNIVYEKETYFTELSKIQMRIDFSRSYLTVSVLLVPVTLLLYTSSEFVRIRRLRNLVHELKNAGNATLRKKKKLSLKRVKYRICRETKVRRIRIGFILAFLILSFFIGVYAYNVEEVNFDKRALGYFSTMKADSGKEAKCE